MSDHREEVPPPLRWLGALAGFLLGVFAVLQWQKRQDDLLLQQMDDPDNEGA